jgi:hypothetical protein
VRKVAEAIPLPKTLDRVGGKGYVVSARELENRFRTD